MLNIKQLEKLENDYLNLQIKEMIEEKEQEERKIKYYFKIKEFILNNLNNKNFNFNFNFNYDENYEINEFQLITNITNLKNSKTYTYILYKNILLNNYEEIQLLTNEEIQKIIDYKNLKYFEQQQTEQEQEF